MEKLPKIKIEEFPLIVTETYSIGSESPINQTVAPYEYDEKTSLLTHVKNPINYHSLNSNNSNTSRKRETIHNNNIAINLALNSNREKKKAYKQEDSVTINVYKPVIKKPDYYELSSERFVEGVKFVTNKAWPVTFLPLMSHDVIFYLVYPNERYGNTLAQTLLGLVPNQASITSHFGSEIMGVNYWGGILLLSTMPIIAGSINALVKPSIKQQLTAYQLERELKDIKLNSRQDILKAIMPWSKLRQFLRRSKFILLKHSDEAQNLAEKKAVIAGINKFLEKHTRYEYFFLRNYALAALANYVKATANLSDIKLQETYLISCSAEQIFEKQIAD